MDKKGRYFYKKIPGDPHQYQQALELHDNCEFGLPDYVNFQMPNHIFGFSPGSTQNLLSCDQSVPFAHYHRYLSEELFDRK